MVPERSGRSVGLGAVDSHTDRNSQKRVANVSYLRVSVFETRRLNKWVLEERNARG
jgi:hypothetical protein